MMKFILIFLLPIFASAKTIKVAVIDSGYTNFYKHNSIPFCKGLHADFAKNKMFLNDPPKDTHPKFHGTNIASLIQKNISQSYSSKYCLIIINYYDDSKNSNMNASNASIQYAIKIGANIINYSGGGTIESMVETAIVKKALDKKIVFVAAAGNEGKSFLKQKFFPAMSDPRVIVVGSVDRQGNRLLSSNFGNEVDIWELGDKVEAGGITMTGTSQATAIVTGKIVNKALRKAQKHDTTYRTQSQGSLNGKAN